ncbi:hypothetical protein TL16_g02197 [Triparma laevis f. inornata]|uniref:Uncharacterized protein n=1 Tax=Triparma laevis f. inornata TaxID=1714386 RepID=A0A9W6ZUB8_9STRA|nr:hypothetical protein TL16_g02197 [Triparma laevis f. inornata]
MPSSGTKLDLFNRVSEFVRNSPNSFDVDSLLSSISGSSTETNGDDPNLEAKVAIEMPPASIPSPSTKFDFSTFQTNSLRSYDTPLKSSKSSSELETKLTDLLTSILEDHFIKQSPTFDSTQIPLQTLQSIKDLSSSPSFSQILDRVFSSLYIQSVAADGINGDDFTKGGGNYSKLSAVDGYINGIIKGETDKRIRDKVSKLLTSENVGTEINLLLDSNDAKSVVEFLKLKENQVSSDILKNVRERIEAEMYVRNSESGWCLRLLYDLQVRNCLGAQRRAGYALIRSLCKAALKLSQRFDVTITATQF